MRKDAASFARARAWLIAALLFGAAAAAWWWTRPADPVAELRARWSPLARLERAPDGGRDEAGRHALHSLERSRRRIDLIARRRPGHDAGP